MKRLSENLEEKTNKIVKKISKKLEEWDQQVTLGYSDGGAPTSLFYTEGETNEELKGKQHKLDVANPKGKITSADFKKLRTMKKGNTEEKGNIRRKTKVGEGEVGEGNKFSGELSKAKKEGRKEFTVDGKTYPVKEGNKTRITFTESQIIDFIERVVKEETAKGLAITNKIKSQDKKENDNYLKLVTKKMKDYLKTGSSGDYSPEGKEFPKSNYQITKDANIMKYNPSEAVEEYIEAFSYPGQTNLRFDEIKPDDKKIEKYLKGHSTTGNAVTDEDGKPLGNVVPSKVGDRFMKNYEENLYGIEQSDASYKRQPQPVDIAGETKKSGKLNKRKTSSSDKSQKILDQLESTEESTENILKEEFGKMKHLIGYREKTQ